VVHALEHKNVLETLLVKENLFHLQRHLLSGPENTRFSEPAIDNVWVLHWKKEKTASAI
jgi:hypothetical protein